MNIIVDGKIYDESDYEELLEKIDEMMKLDTMTDNELFEFMEMVEIVEKYEDINYPMKDDIMQSFDDSWAD